MTNSGVSQNSTKECSGQKFSSEAPLRLALSMKEKVKDLAVIGAKLPNHFSGEPFLAAASGKLQLVNMF